MIPPRAFLLAIARRLEYERFDFDDLDGSTGCYYNPITDYSITGDIAADTDASRLAAAGD